MANISKHLNEQDTLELRVNMNVFYFRFLNRMESNNYFYILSQIFLIYQLLIIKSTRFNILLNFKDKENESLGV